MTPAQQEKTVREPLGGEGADALIPLFKQACPERNILDLLRLDFVFRGPEIDYIAKRSGLNDCTFSYLFNLDQPINGGTSPWHCSDIPYVFHNIDLVEHTHRPDGDNTITERVQEQVFQSALPGRAIQPRSSPRLAALRRRLRKYDGDRRSLRRAA